MESLHQTTGSEELAPLAGQTDTRGVVLDSELDRMIELLRQEGESQRRRFKRLKRLVGWLSSFVGLTLIGFLLFAFVTGRWDILQYMGFLGFTGFLGFLSFLTLASRQHKESARIVAECNDPRALGPLIDSLYISDFKIQTAVSEAVTRLLPRLNAECAAELNLDQVDVLNSHLRQATNAFLSFRPALITPNEHEKVRFGLMIWYERRDALLEAIVNAAPLFGNRETLRQVEQISKAKSNREAAGRLRESAHRVLPALEARVEMLRSGEQLLRPVESHTGETLLRPAAGTIGTDERQLLRPAGDSN